MNNASISAVFVAVILITVLVSAVFWRKRLSMFSFFWGDEHLPPTLTSSLLLSNSFSLNGLLYQVYLGYSIGWWSLAVQAVWCASFIFLMVKRSHFSELLEGGTLHGIVASKFGDATGNIAAVATILGFSIIIGWEAMVGATLLRNVANMPPSVYVALPLVLVFLTAFYTSAGGLRSNAWLDAFQNVAKTTILVAATYMLIARLPGGQSSLLTAPASHVSLAGAAAALGGIGLVANFAFSSVWQVVDMSVWQNLSATTARGRRSALIWAFFLVFVFPGLIGTLIGIALSAFQAMPLQAPLAITDSNILNVFAQVAAPHSWLLLALFGAFSAAMLSTIDGYALGAAQAFTWDIFFKRTTRKLFGLGKDHPVTSDDDRIVSVARIVLTLIALGGATFVMTMVLGAHIDLFDLVYLAVVAQMAIAGPVFFCLFPYGRPVPWRGFAAVAFGLVLGYLCVAAKLVGHAEFYTWAPLAALLTSLLTVYLPNLLFLESDSNAKARPASGS